MLIKKIFKSISKNIEQNSNVKLQAIKQVPRYVLTSSDIFGPPIDIPDSASFLSMYEEIFRRGIYRFETQRKRPLIIDCGANIGLNIIYFNEIFDKRCEIIAFEADDEIFSILEKNMSSLGYENVTLFNRALWDEVTELDFYHEGADAGRITDSNNETERKRIKTVKLSDFLTKRIEFLKIDIEGAETRVLQECRRKLHNVDRVFVEYHSFEGQAQTIDIVIGLLAGAGFRLYFQNITRARQPFIQINSYQGMDVQMNIFGTKDSLADSKI